MIKFLHKTIFFLFASLLFFVPLILWPFTSEVFEFNKMVLVYIFTTLIVSVWLTRIILVRKIIFRRTILDIPLLIFLGSQLISALLSIDPMVSWFGYYSRFNGGLLSIICYSLLYWAFVSNFDYHDALLAIRYWLISATLVSFYGVLEHFGIDKNIWVQDVQSRVFSTLGQPNWLAAWLIALTPITWALAIKDYKLQITNYKFLIYFGLSVLFFWTIIFTKSRSGYFGFAVEFIIFWGIYFWQNRLELKKYVAPFLAIGFSLFAIVLISGTEYTPSLSSVISRQLTVKQLNSSTVSADTSLETGGTESGVIRQIVWKGAVQVWLHYPVFGTGVETFAYSYYKFRPIEHNLTSEWDFIYNKAHNEFLNIAANSGTVGLISYLALIGFSICVFAKNFQSNQNSLKYKSENSQETMTLSLALLAGFVSLSITNFFGFSVVPTQLEFFLFPAIGIVLSTKYTVRSTQYEVQNKENQKISNSQKFLIFLLLPFTIYLLFIISNYWYSDVLYNKGKAYNNSGRPDTAVTYLSQAIKFEPYQSLFTGELSNSYTQLALYYNGQKDTTNAQKFAEMAILESQNAISTEPANLNLKRSQFGIFIKLAAINSNYLLNARDTLIDAITYAPTDAKLYYNLGLTYARIGDLKNSLDALQKAVDLKSNYKEARLAYAILLIDDKKTDEAKAQLNYILTNIDPNDSLTKQTLQSIK